MANSQRWGFMINGKMEMFPIRSRFQANNGDVLLKAAVAGPGITYEPIFSAGELLESGALRQILSTFATPELGIHAVLPGNRHIPHRLRVLMDYLVEQLGERDFPASGRQ